VKDVELKNVWFGSLGKFSQTLTMHKMRVKVGENNALIKRVNYFLPFCTVLMTFKMNKYNMVFLKEELALKQYLMKLLVNETTT
jgi:hypothetical protein